MNKCLQRKKVEFYFDLKYLYFTIFSLLYLQSANSQTPEVWNDFVQAKSNGTQSILPDYSYSGYYFSEKEIPDVSGYTYFDVSEYGVVANDGQYDDDGIQATIDAAVASNNPAVVFFPAGKYLVSSDNDIEKSIYIYGDNIVLKGEGSGENGTEIFMDKMRVENGHWQFRFTPELTNTGTLTTLNSPAKRGDFTVSVASSEDLFVNQSIFIYHKSEEFAKTHYGSLELNEIEWTRLYGDDGGLIVYECHIIESIDGNNVTFKNPIQIDMPTLGEDFRIRNLKTIEGVGIEDIRFTSAWQDYPEDFVHHANDIVDYAWNAVQFKYVKNSWIRNCEFKDWTQVADIRESIGVTVDNVLLSGKRGHSSWITRRNYGVLIKDCVDDANHHHGPGMGYAGVSTVYLRYKMNPNQSIDSHSGSPYVSLLDDIEGGDFHTNGGPWESYPHHARGMTFWNFRHNTTSSIDYDFWSVYDREPATYAEPFFVGLQTSHPVSIIGEGIDDLRDVMVEPRSLFEAQLDLRLNPPLSTDDNAEKNEVKLFPNPFSNSIKIYTKEIDNLNSIHLYNMNGELVEFDYSIRPKEYLLIPNKNLNNGLYILKLLFNNKVKTYRIIKA